MKVVVDTNVLVSGFFPRRTPPVIILDLVLEGILTVCWNEHIIREYSEVLTRQKFRFDPAQVNCVLDYVRHYGYQAPQIPISHALPHGSDEGFLSAAMASGAQWLITGNSRHFPKKIYGPVGIVTPREFLTKFK